jgi:hypothetical protein
MHRSWTDQSSAGVNLVIGRFSLRYILHTGFFIGVAAAPEEPVLMGPLARLQARIRANALDAR